MGELGLFQQALLRYPYGLRDLRVTPIRGNGKAVAQARLEVLNDVWARAYEERTQKGYQQLRADMIDGKLWKWTVPATLVRQPIAAHNPARKCSAGITVVRDGRGYQIQLNEANFADLPEEVQAMMFGKDFNITLYKPRKTGSKIVVQ